MFDASRTLIREWDGSGMEEDGCCCCCCRGGAAELHRHSAVLQLPRHKDTRLQRATQFLVVACVLLISVTLALLVTFVLGARGHHAPDNQPTKQPESHSPGYAEKYEDITYPLAMLTAPIESPPDDVVPEGYLKWESDRGNAFCHGGLSYSNGNLVVPGKGTYRVFLQITYESKNSCSQWLELNNHVYFISDDYPKYRELLSSVDTVDCRMVQWSKTIYTSGLFHLEANTNLSVKSSHPELIVKKEQLVFFGVEYLSP